MLTTTIRMDMSMLPSASAESGQPHVLIYLITSDTADLTELCTNLGGQLESTNPAVMRFSAMPQIAIIIHSQSQIDARITQSCDALVVALDGSTGVGPETFILWQQARDQSLPRHFLATNTVHGRADFDELSAIAIRTMEPDLMIRYLPIDSDDESSLAGIYDLLTSEIQTGTAPDWITVSADPEHIAITSTAREELFDHLAYSGLDDATLANHRAGLPISVTKLESAWLHPDVVSITPVDFKVGIKVFSSWIANLDPMWLPILVEAESTTDVSNAQERIGIAITNEIARMWGDQSQEALLMIKNGDGSKVDVDLDSPAIIVASELSPGATLRNSTSNSLLFTPAF
jgi:hypothetical protein